MASSLTSPATPLKVGSLKLDAFSHILLSIFRGDLPTGTRLKVQHLAAQFGISSTPVREALVELAGLGVVETLPNRGSSVAPFGVKEVREIYHVRKLLEVEAARMACQSVRFDELQEVAAETTSLQQIALKDADWAAACIESDRRMHHAVVVAAGSSRLKAELQRYGRLMHIIRILTKSPQSFHDQILAEHAVALAAILDRDERAAMRAMELHLDHTCERAIEGIFAT